jgi:hypothetical protein
MSKTLPESLDGMALAAIDRNQHRSVYEPPSSRVVGHPSTKAKRSRQPSTCRLDADMIVHGTPDSLLAAQITFRRLH